eukprot:1519164-Rhodomonas_salina.2
MTRVVQRTAADQMRRESSQVDEAVDGQREEVSALYVCTCPANTEVAAPHLSIQHRPELVSIEGGGVDAINSILPVLVTEILVLEQENNDNTHLGNFKPSDTTHADDDHFP